VKAQALELQNNEIVSFGDSASLHQYHNGTDGFIDNITGKIRLRVNHTEDSVVCTPNAQTELYYNGIPRFKTSNVGVQISADGSIWSGILETAEVSPTGTVPLAYNGYFYATRVHNAVWNDLADFHLLDDELVYGKCYYQSPTGSKLCTKTCQKGLIGIASDTFGISAGLNKAIKTVPISVAGWVLGFVDKEYESGTPLMNDKVGNLTQMPLWRKILYPERMVATYGYKEKEEMWGPEDSQVVVNGRHWIKIS
jgi:hypothetical protein